MPICRLQKNHALSRRRVLPPLFRLIHPQPLMTQAKQNKERFIHRRSVRSLVPSSCSLSFPVPLLSTPFCFSLSLFLFLYLDGPPVSFALFLSSSSRAHQLVLTLSFVHRHARSLAPDAGSLSHPVHSHCPSVCLSILPTHTHLLLFLSFRGLARSLAHMRANEID